MTTETKVQLILELKNRMTTGIVKAKQSVSRSTDEMKQKLNSLKDTHIKAFQAMKAEIPGFSRAIEMLKNPFILLTASVMAAGMAIKKFSDFTSECIALSTQQAESEAKLAQVMKNTMNASVAEISSIKKLAEEQEKIGVIGAKEQIAGAQELSTYLTQSDSLKKLMPVMNDMLAQQYGLNATQEQAVGIATMMGKVMDGQVGALSRYGYKFDEAQEKILKYGTESQRAATLFDVVAGSVGGVNEALAATPEGKMKQMEDRAESLKERWGSMALGFKTMWNPAREAMLEFWTKIMDFVQKHETQIKNVISGIADFIAGVIHVVYKTIRGLKSAFDFLWEWKEVILGVAAAWLLYNGNMVIAGISTAALGIKTAALTAAQWALNIAMNANPIGIIILAIGALVGAIIALVKKYEGWATVWEAVKTLLVNSFKQLVANYKFYFQEIWSFVQIFMLRLKGFGEYVSALFAKVGEAVKLALSGNFKEAKEALKGEIKTKASVEIEQLQAERQANREAFAQESINRAKEIKEAFSSISIKKKAKEETETKTENPFAPAGALDDDTTNKPTGDPPLGDTTGSVTGSAAQIRNITVNIDAFNKGGINTQNTELSQMSPEGIEDWFNQMLLRVIRNVETSY